MYLYKIYKNIKQRSVRHHSYCELRAEMTQLARQIFEGDKSAEDILQIASELKSIEVQLYGIKTYFSDQIKRAVENNKYSLEFPDVISHMKTDNDKYGSIYVITAPSKKNQVKIGATTIEPNKRLSVFIHRYGYEAKFYFISETIRAPFSLEDSIKKDIKYARVSGIEYGDSNEWYLLKPEQLKSIILDAIENWRK